MHQEPDLFVLSYEQSLSKVLDDPLGPDTAFMDKEIPQYTRDSTAVRESPSQAALVPPFTGGSRAETREATGLETGWRGGVLLFLMLHVHEERRWPRASSSTVSWAV